MYFFCKAIMNQLQYDWYSCKEKRAWWPDVSSQKMFTWPDLARSNFSVYTENFGDNWYDDDADDADDNDDDDAGGAKESVSGCRPGCHPWGEPPWVPPHWL